MLKFLNDLPQNVVGLEVEGEVTREEYEATVVPKMEQLARLNDEINYVIILKSGITSFSAGVWWDDFKMMVKHYKKWNRIAIVTDQQLVKTTTDIFGFALPGEHKLFPLTDLEKAVWWASEAHSFQS